MKTQFQTIRMNGNEDNTVKSDIIIHLFFCFFCSSLKFSPSVCRLGNFCSPFEYCVLVSVRENRSMALCIYPQH